jgi:hypothetical protein
MSSVRKHGTSSRKTSGTVSSVRDRSGGTSSSARAPTSSARSSDRASAFTNPSSATAGVTRLDRSSVGGASSANNSVRSRDVGRSRSGEGLTSSSKLPPQESLMEIVQKRFVNDVFESAAGKLILRAVDGCSARPSY